MPEADDNIDIERRKDKYPSKYVGNKKGIEMMSRKAIIAMVGLVLFLAVVGVGCRNTNKGREERLDLSKIPEPKLVAEYKFNSPISDAVFYDNGKLMVVATEAFIRFYYPNGSVRKEIKTKDIKHKENGMIINSRETAQISKNGEYVAVMHNVKMGIGWVKYLDKNGNILFEKNCPMGAYWISPKGDYVVFDDLNKIIYVDSKGKEIKRHEKTSIEKIAFTRNGEYVAIAGTGDNVRAVILFNANGDIIRKDVIAIDIDSISISDMGNYYVVGGSIWDNKHSDVISYPVYLFNRKGIVLEKKDNGPNVTISPDGGTVYYCKFPRRYPYREQIETYFEWFAIKNGVKGGVKRSDIERKVRVAFIKCALLGRAEVLFCFIEKNNDADNAYLIVFDRKSMNGRVIRFGADISKEYYLIDSDINAVGEYFAIKGKTSLRVYQL